MKMPWTKRAEAAERRAAEAEAQRARVEARWTRVEAVTDRAREHYELNGWTSTVLAIFSGEGGSRRV